MGNSAKSLMAKIFKEESEMNSPIKDLNEFSRKEIDKRKIIIKRPARLQEIEADENNRIDTELESESNFDGILDKLNQNYLEEKYENLGKYEESKYRHKKTPAISLNNFIGTIKGFPQSNKNDNLTKIKYPANINPNVSSTKNKNYERMNKLQVSNPEINAQQMSNTQLQSDQRREMPRQGYTGSGADSKGSGGIKNFVSHNEIEHDESKLFLAFFEF